MNKTAWISLMMVLLAVAMFITSCSSTSSNTPAATTTTITGSLYAAPVTDASVIVLTAAGNPIAGPVNTASDGTYNVNVPTSALTSDFRIESTGGTYTDEATGLTTTAGIFAAYFSGGTLTTGPAAVHIGPCTTVINNELTTNSTLTFIGAQAFFHNAFGYTPDSSVAPSNMPSNGSNNAQRLAAYHAGVFSQLNASLGFTHDKQGAMLNAIAQDLADDGILNGSSGSVNGMNLTEDIQNRYEQAMISYLSNTTANRTGLTAADIGGELPFSKVALTNTYRVQYLPGMMAATTGKTSFQIRITKRSDGSPATGLTVSLMPTMHMASMNHSSPVDIITEDSSPGVYNCTIYYLMGDGSQIGYWALAFMIGSGMDMETATFYPAVSMGMGTDTIDKKLYGPDDIVTAMSGTLTNNYFLFRDGVVSAATPTINLFIAHSESMMMNFKAVSIGAILSNPTGTVTSMTVQASMDSSFSSLVAGTDKGNGHWSLSGLTGLVSGQTATIYVKVNVNGQDKTTDGNAASGSNAYATFLVTPGM